MDTDIEELFKQPGYENIKIVDVKDTEEMKK